jgi:hypothetical protein
MASDPKEVEQDVAPASGPPAERPTAIWTRRFVILAFWTVVVCLGLPLWTWTTTIHRSELPLESMNAWAEGHVSGTRCSPRRIKNAANIFRRLANSIFHCKYPCLPASCLQNSERMWLLGLKLCSTVEE